jgi:stage II sporulation protein D
MISASALRFAIGRAFGWNEVRSDLYEIENAPVSVIFSGRGGGHGVGLCQAGAEEMAREGKSYREILAFYYPGTSLGVTAASGLQWQRRSGERVEILTAQPDQESDALAAAEKILPELESTLGWRLDFKPQIKVYPSLDAYRNSTGQPGWVAALTRGQTISLQPPAILRARAIAESTLRHELAHLLIETRARPGTPLWFREGLVLYFTGRGNSEPVIMTDTEMEAALHNPEDRQRLERAYAAARTRVAKMVEKNGKATVLDWLNHGLPH